LEKKFKRIFPRGWGVFLVYKAGPIFFGTCPGVWEKTREGGKKSPTSSLARGKGGHPGGGTFGMGPTGGGGPGLFQGGAVGPGGEKRIPQKKTWCRGETAEKKGGLWEGRLHGRPENRRETLAPAEKSPHLPRGGEGGGGGPAGPGFFFPFPRGGPGAPPHRLPKIGFDLFFVCWRGWGLGWVFNPPAAGGPAWAPGWGGGRIFPALYVPPRGPWAFYGQKGAPGGSPGGVGDSPRRGRGGFFGDGAG